MKRTRFKKQIGVLLDNKLWWKFKAAAAEEESTAGKLLEKLIKEYLDNKSKTNDP